jgi:two-component system response regulator MtrA
MRVVIADDDDDVRRVVGLMLRGEGLEIVAVATGTDALGAVEAAPTALLIADITIPGMSGITLAYALAARGFDVPVVLISGRPELVTGASRSRLIQRVIAKPFRMAELCAGVREILRRPVALE